SGLGGGHIIGRIKPKAQPECILGAVARGEVGPVANLTTEGLGAVTLQVNHRVISTKCVDPVDHSRTQSRKVHRLDAPTLGSKLTVATSSSTTAGTCQRPSFRFSTASAGSVERCGAPYGGSASGSEGTHAKTCRTLV